MTTTMMQSLGHLVSALTAAMRVTSSKCLANNRPTGHAHAPAAAAGDTNAQSTQEQHCCSSCFAYVESMYMNICVQQHAMLSPVCMCCRSPTAAKLQCVIYSVSEQTGLLRCSKPVSTVRSYSGNEKCVGKMQPSKRRLMCLHLQQRVQGLQP
jgi:hypothetical protein